jgi:hypothetical protein
MVTARRGNRESREAGKKRPIKIQKSSGTTEKV